MARTVAALRRGSDRAAGTRARRSAGLQHDQLQASRRTYRDGCRQRADRRLDGRPRPGTADSLGRTPVRIPLSAAHIVADVEWTFPLNFVEVISGDGTKSDRQVISTTDLAPMGSHHFEIPFDAAGKKWVRFAAWDSAGNGAMAQPVKLAPAAAAPGR